MSRPLFVSVVVCTRNRSEVLKESSAALWRMDYPPDRWEVLIVDNHSSDDTLTVARDIASMHPGRVQVIEERELGISVSRNAGIQRARGEVIAFLDDDSFPEPGWLSALVEVLTREPEALVVGGPVEPWFAGELPSWFGERFHVYVTAWDKGPEVRKLTYNDYPRGANMAFRREVFARFGNFNAHLGYKGTGLMACDETELCLRVERSGGRILYVPRARVRHLTAASRITPAWLARRFQGQAHSEAILEWRHSGWLGLYRGWRQFARNARATVRQRHRSAEDKILARCTGRALLGYTLGLLRAPLTIRRYRPPVGTAEWLSPLA